MKYIKIPIISIIVLIIFVVSLVSITIICWTNSEIVISGWESCLYNWNQTYNEYTHCETKLILCENPDLKEYLK